MTFLLEWYKHLVGSRKGKHKDKHISTPGSVAALSVCRLLTVAALFSSEETIFCATSVPCVSNMLSVAVGVRYTYRNCNGGRNYILRSNAVRHTELQVTVVRAVPTDLERVSRLARRHISGNDLDLNSEVGRALETGSNL